MEKQGSQITNGFFKTSVAPIDWGLTFALSNKAKLFQFVLLPMLVSIVGNYTMWANRLQSGQRMLVAIASIIVTVWLWSMILIYCIGMLKGQKYSFYVLANKAAANVPKIFASYVTCFVLILFGLSTLVIPGIVFLGYFIWAPAFCIAEVCVDKSKLKKSDDEEFDPSVRELSYFKYKSLLELGLVRSWRLAAPHFSTSFYVVLLVVFSLIVPMAFVDLMFPDKVSFAPHAVSVMLTSFSGVIAVGAWAGAFLQLLPIEARKEIELPLHYDLSSVSGAKKEVKKCRFANRPILHFLLLSIIALCGWVVLQAELKSRDLPTGVTVNVNQIDFKDGEVKVNLEMYDDRQKFRWLDTDNFRVSVNDEIVLAPNKSMAFDESEQFLDPYNLSPYDGKLKLELSFEAPQEMPKGGELKLTYISFTQDSGPPPTLYSGRFGESW